MSSPAHPERTSKIYLARHGATEWSRNGRHTSVTDLPLLPDGEDQARELGRAIGGHGFELVLTSPRERAMRTAELAGFAATMRVDPDLAEWDYGAYESLTSPEISERIGREWFLWDDGVPAGATPGEDREDVRRRALAVIARCEPVIARGGDVLLVAHSHFLRSFAAAWLSLPARAGSGFTLDTGSVSILGFDHDRPVIARWNCPATAL